MTSHHVGPLNRNEAAARLNPLAFTTFSRMESGLFLKRSRGRHDVNKPLDKILQSSSACVCVFKPWRHEKAHQSVHQLVARRREKVNSESASTAPHTLPPKPLSIPHLDNPSGDGRLVQTNSGDQPWGANVDRRYLRPRPRVGLQFAESLRRISAIATNNWGEISECGGVGVHCVCFVNTPIAARGGNGPWLQKDEDGAGITPLGCFFHLSCIETVIFFSYILCHPSNCRPPRLPPPSTTATTTPAFAPLSPKQIENRCARWFDGL